MENRTQRRENEVLYVYDRICPKESKKRELYKQYGVRRSAAEKGNARGGSVHTRTRGGTARVDERGRYGGAPRPNPAGMSVPHGSAGANRPRRTGSGRNAERPYAERTARPSANAGYASRERVSRPSYKSASTSQRRGDTSHVYTYRPESPSRRGETVTARPLKLLLEKVVNLFESVEERGRRDEITAKRQAIARKKLYEYRHTIGTALLVLLILAAFVFLVYKLFFVISDIDASGATMYTENGVIAASGILEGDNLYSFTASDAEERITFHCPYIKSAEISRTLPNTVTITVEEDAAMYVAEIYGERVILSAGLRVLGYADDGASAELTELVLPPVDYSVAGRVITFADERNDRYIREVLSTVSSDSFLEMSDVDRIDLTYANDIKMSISGKYIFKLGSDADCSLKLRMAEKTLTNSSFDRTKPATIDLSKVGEASVRYDPKLFEK